MIKLRPYQLEGMAKLWEYFQNGGKGNPLICWPTGVGKTIIPAFFIKEVMKVWPNQRFILMSHVSELIKQDAEALLHMWPQAPLGIFSAGLKQKEPYFPIVYAGIQSAIKDPARFGFRDIAFVDEAHLISQDESSQYLRFFETLKLINPNLRIIGLTATPFRMGMGYITDGGLFTDIVHDMTSLHAFNKMIEDGYLAPLVPRRTKTELDVSNVGMAKGEFIAKQLQAAVDKEELNYAIVKEIVEAGQNRQSWLIFSSGIEHAEHISTLINSFGISCAAVHSKQKAEFNNDAITAFKQNELRSIVNYGKLTTGFNHPAIDLIGMVRATMSVPLWVQMLGRGTRPNDGKDNCLVLDFARNTPRLGPINDPIIPRKKGEKAGDTPVKICEACGVYNHARVRFCTNCNNEFEFQVKIVAKPGTEELIKSNLPIIEIFDVDKVIYNAHNKLGSPQSMKVTYFCNMQMFKEFICLEHGGYAKRIAHEWWKKRHNTEAPKTTQEALQFVSQLKVPKKIHVWCNKKHPEILKVEF
jgi:superfamily II DNA or RNA helicase